ncbi:MAG TPA: hypothetical protein K8W19_14390, partial [Victivallis vadensis]|nr:hypothetical protein [Victivallis vadensis]
PAGNILSKTVAGKTTTYTYDKANQLVSSKNADGKVTKYEYDAAGRMVKEGERTFAYGWLDKVMQVAENGKTTQSYSYDISGQLATADYGAGKETFLWDGLALLSRNNLKYVNEPAVTGGNPILAGDKMLFDDALGNTLGVKDGEKFSAIDRDAFGELKPGERPNLAVNFFTGKPEIDGLGYSFLFRNYRADLGKWQTTDPLGYPDGWNNLAYVNNGVTMAIDWMGGCTVIDGLFCDVVKRETSPGIEVFAKTIFDYVFTCGGSAEVDIKKRRTFSGSLALPLEFMGSGLNPTFSWSFDEEVTSKFKNPFHPPTDTDKIHKTRGTHGVAQDLYCVVSIITTTYECGNTSKTISTSSRIRERVTEHTSCVYE